MTTLLERAIAEIEKLSPDIQDAIAARLLAELADETQWQTQFAATTDEQWQKMVVAVQAEIAEEKIMPLEQFRSEFEKQVVEAEGLEPSSRVICPRRLRA